MGKPEGLEVVTSAQASAARKARLMSVWGYATFTSLTGVVLALTPQAELSGSPSLRAAMRLADGWVWGSFLLAGGLLIFSPKIRVRCVGIAITLLWATVWGTGFIVNRVLYDVGAVYPSTVYGAMAWSGLILLLFEWPRRDPVRSLRDGQAADRGTGTSAKRPPGTATLGLGQRTAARQDDGYHTA